MRDELQLLQAHDVVWECVVADFDQHRVALYVRYRKLEVAAWAKQGSTSKLVVVSHVLNMLWHGLLNDVACFQHSTCASHSIGCAFEACMALTAMPRFYYI
jgi:hypothetical protein